MIIFNIIKTIYNIKNNNMKLSSYFSKDICNIINDYQYFKTFIDIWNYYHGLKLHIYLGMYGHTLRLSTIFAYNFHPISIICSYNINIQASHPTIVRIQIYKWDTYYIILYINSDEYHKLYLNLRKIKLNKISKILNDSFEIIHNNVFNINDFLKIKKYNEAFIDTDFMIKLYEHFKLDSYVLRMLKNN
jgi:hypothetical protein